MQLKKIIPALMVENIDATIAFYENVLGFELVLTVPSITHIDWAMMKCGEVEIMFHAKAGHAEKKNHDRAGTLTFHFQGEGVKELYDAVRNKAKILRHLYPTFYGMNEFSMMDCNGCVLVFSEKIENEEQY
ncbi:MAG: VOC family protein [Dissulfurispiraceae bacterium]